jgi:hypothetical protein
MHVSDLLHTRHDVIDTHLPESLTASAVSPLLPSRPPTASLTSRVLIFRMRILKNDTCNSFTFNLCTPAIASGAYFGATRHRLCTEIEPRQPYSHLKMRWFTPRQDYPNLPSYSCEDPLRRAYGTGVETLMGPGLPRGAEGCNRSRMHAWRAPKHAYMAPSHDIARGTYESTATLKHAPRRGRVHTPPMADRDPSAGQTSSRHI